MLAINISDKKAITTSYLESELEDIPEQRLYGKSLYVFDEFAQEISTPFRLIPDDVDDDKYTGLVAFVLTVVVLAIKRRNQ